MNTPFGMQGKRVLVTGAGTGIGKEVALEFCRSGADVVFHYSGSREGALAAVGQAQREGTSKVAAIQADFRNKDAAARLGREAVDFLGGLDVLINNASITMNRPFEQVEPEQFDTLYNVNIRSMFFLAQAAVPVMRRQGGGAIINFSSIHAFEGHQEHTVYAGTKGAIVSFTRALAVELAPQGIRVNGISPGAVEVENHHKIFPDHDPAAFGRMIPCGFLGQPADIAKAAVFLASDAARYIVGQTLIIDGGTTSWMPFGDGFRRPMDVQFGQGYVPGL
jgi:NAD(P)-dependent dehydrogenase (short-subunit alcohol dehydrogenase family)